MKTSSYLAEDDGGCVLDNDEMAASGKMGGCVTVSQPGFLKGGK